MKWPWVSRRHHVAAIRRMAGYVQALTTENDDLRKSAIHAYAQKQQVEAMLDESIERERRQRWARLKAEGLAQFKDDRIRAALALLYREESGVKKAG